MKKRIIVLTIVNITILVCIFNFFYPEVSPAALTTVLALIGFALALAENAILKKYNK